jgi:ankyrin repeat protein
MPQEGCTPLHRAVDNGHADMVLLLLEAGANKEVANKVGRGRA